MRPKRTVRLQVTPDEICEQLLRFIQTKFYQGNPLAFMKDRKRLLDWVVLKFAAWLDERAVSIPPHRYLEIMRDKVLMEAVRHGAANIKYVPAWLGKTVEEHLKHHGEEYYDEAKAIRNVTDNVLMFAQGGVTGRDPIRQLADARRLLKAGKKPAVKPAKNDQLTLL